MSWDPFQGITPYSPAPTTLSIQEMQLRQHEQLVARMMEAREQQPELGPSENKFGEIEALKLFSVSYAADGTPLLASPYQNTVWLPQTLAKADTPPSEDRNTGVYVWKNVLAVRKEEKGDTLAEVLIWGDVVEHLYGYRAQYCRIEAIKDTESETPLEDLQAAYDWQETL